jgi:hypothetical protein
MRCLIQRTIHACLGMEGKDVGKLGRGEGVSRWHPMNVARCARHRERSEAILPCHHIILDGFAALGMAGASPPALITSPSCAKARPRPNTHLRNSPEQDSSYLNYNR